MIRICSGSCLPKMRKMHIHPPGQLPSYCHLQSNSGQEVEETTRNVKLSGTAGCTYKFLPPSNTVLRSPQIHVKQACKVSSYLISLPPSLMQTSGINGDWLLGCRTVVLSFWKWAACQSATSMDYAPIMSQWSWVTATPWSGSVPKVTYYSVWQRNLLGAESKWMMSSVPLRHRCFVAFGYSVLRAKQVKINCTGKLNQEATFLKCRTQYLSIYVWCGQMREVNPRSLLKLIS